MTQHLDGYARRYYERDIRENWFHWSGLLRPDQLAAIAYAHNWPFFGDEDYGHRPQQRKPARIMSVGCGRGDVEVELERLGYQVIGVDPSEGAAELYRGTTLQATPEGVEDCDTVLFVESLEHLPTGTIDDLWRRFTLGTRVVIVNWPDFHPIEADGGWDHITTVDDALFDRLSEGWRVVVRRGSHLVLDK